MIAGPLLLLASTVVGVTGDGIGESGPSGVLQVYAMVGLLFAVVAVTGICEAWFPRAAAGMTLIGAVGIAGGVAYGINGIYLMNGATDLNSEVAGVTPHLVLHIPGLLLPATFIGLGFLLFRTSLQPRWCGPALMAGGVLFPISRIGEIPALAPVPDALFLLGLLPLGLALLTGRDYSAAEPKREPEPELNRVRPWV
jgi:hypothetical protein